MKIQNHKPYRTEHTGILCVSLNDYHGNHFMIVPPNDEHPQYVGAFFVLGPSGRIVARDPRLAGLHLNVIEELPA